MNDRGLPFGLRFDLRNPALAGTSTADRYAAAIEMAAWADRLGCRYITLSEHHGSPDGYLPSPIPMVAAMAARTERVRFTIGALIAPFHDPLRLAEDLAELRGSPAPFARLHPLCGGMPIELAWSSLRLFETEVLPAFAA